MEKIKKIKAIYHTYLYCDKCGALMEPTGNVLCSYPPQYGYICPKCDFSTHSFKSYPETSIEYEED